MATQANREFAVATKLPDDDLLFVSMTAVERISDLFEFDLELMTEKAPIEIDGLLGTNMTVRVNTDGATRYYNGYVASLSLSGERGGYAVYHATLRPWLWFLTRNRDCRIFQGLSVPDIVQEVLRDHHFTDLSLRLSGSYLPWEYCVQYQESDFDFISRLLEHEGIYYYFTHRNGAHTLVLGDGQQAHDALATDGAKLSHRPHPQPRELARSVTDWTVTGLVPVGGYLGEDFDYERPGEQLKVGDGDSDITALSGITQYEYPARITYAQKGSRPQAGQALARTRAQEIACHRRRITGRTAERRLGVAQHFTMDRHPDKAQNGKYLIIGTMTDVVAGSYEGLGGYSGGGLPFLTRFEVIPADLPFRPQRTTPWPVMRGPQTAIVTGKGGADPAVDEQGRVTVRFHWDRRDPGQQHTSCAIRVSQAWAGRNWGAQFLPRIGQEVIVDFLDGDPNKPIITGRVYNPDTEMPFNPKSRPTVSGFRSSSTPGGDGANEFWFDDQAGSEQFFLHAQRHYDVRVRRELAEHVGSTRHTTIVGERRQRVGGDEHLITGGDRNMKVEGTLSLTVKEEWQQQVTGNAGLDVGGEWHLKAGTNLVLEAGTKITIKAGGSFITVGPEGVVISGPLVKVNSGGSAGSGTGASPEVPRRPRAALDPNPGGTTKEPPSRRHRPTPAELDSHPVSAQMQLAHRDAIPFCAPCAKPKSNGMR